MTTSYKVLNLTHLLRTTTEAFFAADVNGDQVLSFEEFCEVVPDEMREQETEATLLELFDAADTDGNGSISKDEYLFWVLRWAAFDSGMSQNIKDTFQKFDSGGDGEVNMGEFIQAIAPYGFGDVAHQIFRELDNDGSGTIKFEELLGCLKLNHVQNMSDDAKRLLVKMSFADNLGRPGEDDAEAHAAAVKEKLDKTPWSADTGADVRETLQRRRILADISAMDLWREMVRASASKAKTMRMSKTVFLRAVRNATGYNGKDPALNEAFAQIDDDQEGFACFDEFSCWIDGRTGRRAMARSLTLASERPTDDPEFPPLREVQWDATVLLRELNRMLEHNGCSSYDLLSAHDSSSDGSLEKKEFIIMIKRVINDEEVWPEAKQAAKALFEKAAGKDASLDVEEFERLLYKVASRVRGKGASRHVGSSAAAGGGLQPKMIRQLMREHPMLISNLALSFHEADIDGDETVSFLEFCELLPPDLLGQAHLETLRELFRLADSDGDGALTQDEFFFWSLNANLGGEGASWDRVRGSFERVDSDGSGMLSEDEFILAARPFKYSDEEAKAAFQELDADQSGMLAYGEIKSSVEEHCKGAGGLSQACRKLLTAMALKDPNANAVPAPAATTATAVTTAAATTTAAKAEGSPESLKGSSSPHPKQKAGVGEGGKGLSAGPSAGQGPAAQTEEERTRRAEDRVRRRNAALDMGKANARAAKAERDRLLTIEAENLRTQRVRRQIMEAREKREERRFREPTSDGCGALPMREAAAAIGRKTLRRPASAGGLLMVPPGVVPHRAPEGMISTSVMTANTANYPTSWLPRRLHEPPDPSRLPGLKLPFKPPAKDPNDTTSSVLQQMRQARKTPLETPQSKVKASSSTKAASSVRIKPPLPQNNVNGFDFPTYGQQAFTGCDRRSVPFW